MLSVTSAEFVLNMDFIECLDDWCFECTKICTSENKSKFLKNVLSLIPKDNDMIDSSIKNFFFFLSEIDYIAP